MHSAASLLIPIVGNFGKRMFASRATLSREVAVEKWAKAFSVDEERPKGNSTSIPCRYCGNDAKSRDASEMRLQPARYQVIVACASCGAAFAALSRN